MVIFKIIHVRVTIMCRKQIHNKNAQEKSGCWHRQIGYMNDAHDLST